MHRLFSVRAPAFGFEPDILGAIFFDEQRHRHRREPRPRRRTRRWKAAIASRWRMRSGTGGCIATCSARTRRRPRCSIRAAPPSVVCRSSQAKERDRVAGRSLCLLRADAAQAGHGGVGRGLPRRQAAGSQIRHAVRPWLRGVQPRNLCHAGPGSRPKPTIRRLTVSRRLSRRNFSSRRSLCASGWKSSGFCTARFRFNGFCPMARRPFLEEIVKCQLDERIARTKRATTPRSRRATSISPASCAAPATSFINLRAEGRRKVFVFQDRATRRDDVMAFYGDATTVRPLAFAATIKDMKGLLHNG